MSAKKPAAEKIGSIPPFGLRMLPGLKRRIELAIEVSGRSMNAEIIARLEQSFETDAIQDDPAQLQATLLPLTKAVAALMDERYSDRLDQVQEQLAEVTRLLRAGALSEADRREIQDAIEDAADAAIYDERMASLTEADIFPPELSAFISKGQRRITAIRNWRAKRMGTIAKLAGIGRLELAEIELGRKKLTPKTAEKLASVLGVPLSWIKE